jgi:hypothetical protein
MNILDVEYKAAGIRKRLKREEIVVDSENSDKTWGEKRVV